MQLPFIIKIFLFPLYILFYGVVWVKNKLFDYQILKSYKPNIFTVNVGNLAVGGTGKTPMVEYLVDLFSKQKIAILSRGYGRKTKGFKQAGKDSDAISIGDEPFQYFLKFGKNQNIFVGENRVEAYQKLMALKPETNVLLLDDAFQHRSIQAHLNIVLSDYNRLIYNDLLVPIGRLREPISSLKRTEILIVTKCPANLTEAEAQKIETCFKPYLKDKRNIYFTKISYGDPIQFNGETTDISKKILLASAIAQPKPFQDYCKNKWEVEMIFNFPDHHHFTEKDIQEIERHMNNSTSLLVTEKDFVKLNGQLPNSVKAYYLPIKTSFLFAKKPVFEERLTAAFNIFYQK